MATRDAAQKMVAKVRKPGRGLTIVAADARARAEFQKKQARARARVGTTFRLEAPQAAEAFVAGCFNGWNPAANPLERDERGAWSCSLAIEPGEHEYRFVVDGVWWDDPANMSRRWNDFGTQNCILIVQG
jgi:1,4-alpha-glucan branching enzyme